MTANTTPDVVGVAQNLLKAVQNRDILKLEVCLEAHPAHVIKLLLESKESDSLWHLLISNLCEGESTGFNVLAKISEGWSEGGQRLWCTLSADYRKGGERSSRYPSLSVQLDALLAWGMYEEAERLVSARQDSSGTSSALPQATSSSILSELHIIESYVLNSCGSRLLPTFIHALPLEKKGTEEENTRLLKTIAFVLSANDQEWPKVKHFLARPNTSTEEHFLALAATKVALFREKVGAGPLPQEKIWARLDECIPGYMDRTLHALTTCLERGRDTENETVPSFELYAGPLLRAFSLPDLQERAAQGGSSMRSAITVLACLYRPPEEASSWVEWTLKHEGEGIFLNPLRHDPALTLFDILAARTSAFLLDHNPTADVLTLPSKEGTPAPLATLMAWSSASRTLLPFEQFLPLEQSMHNVLESMLLCQYTLFKRSLDGLPRPAKRRKYPKSAPAVTEILIDAGMALEKNWWWNPSAVTSQTVNALESWWRHRESSSIFKIPAETSTSCQSFVQDADMPPSRAAAWCPLLEPLHKHILWDAVHLEATLSQEEASAQNQDAKGLSQSHISPNRRRI